MSVLLLKLVLTPGLIDAATLAARRWGPGVGGWLVGLPLTSGPVAFFLAVDHGSRFAVASSAGSIGGAAAEAGFCLAYAAVGRRASWLAAIGAGSLGFVLASVAIQPALTLPLAGEIAVVLGVLACSFVVIPSAGTRAIHSVSPPWDLPARMVAGTTIVVLLTAIAPALGPHLTGLVAAFPVYAVVLAGFTHHLDGRAQAMEVLRGLLIGLVAFTGFFAVINVTLESLELAVSFGAALIAALLIQGTTLSTQWILRPKPGSG
ncbi:MAG: hypothetical protein ACLQBX_10640 [Candidatus Limnocylindrales bacterium]|jgi:uncharacterized membrane protein (GlpM family)